MVENLINSSNNKGELLLSLITLIKGMEMFKMLCGDNDL